MKKETLAINKENMKLLKTLIMYAEDDLQFYKQITDYIYRLGHNLSDYKKESLLRDKLHEISEILNEIFSEKE